MIDLLWFDFPKSVRCFWARDFSPFGLGTFQVVKSACGWAGRRGDGGKDQLHIDVH